jgi:hypothetical protein
MQKIKANIIDDKKIKKIILQKNQLPFLSFIYLLIHGKKFKFNEITHELQAVFAAPEKQISDALFVLGVTAGLIKTGDNSLEIIDYESFIADGDDVFIMLPEDYFENGENGNVKKLLKKENGFEIVELWILTLFTAVLCDDDGRIGKNKLINKLTQLQGV